MNWSVLTKKQKQMVITTIVVAIVQVVLLVHFLGLTKPEATRGGSAKEELIKFEQKLASARTIVKQEPEIRQELAQSIKELEALAGYAPTFSDRYAWAYEYVSRASTQARVEVDSLEEVNYLVADKKDAGKKDAGKKDTVKKDAVKKDAAETVVADPPYEIAVSTRCGYNNLVEFLWRLEKDNPLLRIKEVTISARTDQPLAHQVRIVIQWPVSVKIEGKAK
ncbi:MAG: hypothetical protein WCH86_03450 [Kiritimatiellales bacterium]